MRPYPLAWPAARPRKAPDERRSSRFSTTSRSTGRTPKPLTLYEARERLQAELDRIGATSPVLSTDVELRLDGAPRSGREPADPGVAVYFVIDGRAHSMPCDTYTRVADNVAAVAAHIEATRAILRHGVATLGDLLVFAALQAPAGREGVILLPPPAGRPPSSSREGDHEA